MNAPASIPGRAPVSRPERWALAALALGVALLNSAKPLCIDDAAYYVFAHHLADHPLDPYGFTLFWYDAPQPGISTNLAPAFCYWWSLAIRLAPHWPWVWKLWLTPLVGLLVAALWELAGRFAYQARWPLTLGLILGPACLPGWNLMLDLPALALALAALAVLLRAVERDSLGAAVLAGLVAALAVQTKYTALSIVVAMPLVAWLAGRPRLGTTAAGVALLLAALWEGLIYRGYGTSIFWVAVSSGVAQTAGHPWAVKLRVAGQLIPVAGGTLLLIPILGLVATGWRRLAAAIALASLLGYAVLGWGVAGPPAYGLANRLYAAQGAMVLAAAGCAWMRALRHRDLAERVLAAWLVCEVAGCLILSPFPAVRRLLGPALAATLLVGRVGLRVKSSSPDEPSTGPGPRPAWSIPLGYAVILGGLFAAIDALDARAERDAVRQAQQVIDQTGESKATVWYRGHWGWQFYAEQAGFRPLVGGQSRLTEGDWVLRIDDWRAHQTVELSAEALARVETIELDDPWPWKTIPSYYSWYRPLEHRDDPRLVLRIDRVTRAATADLPSK